MQHTKAAYVGRLLSALTGLTSLVACNQAAPPGSPPPPTVTVSKPEEKLVENWSEFTGRTAAVNFVNVTPRVSSYIVDIPFKEGDLVHQGDLLFQIDPRPYHFRSSWNDANIFACLKC
jgi:multidrug efflux pump subunit AcrA (membrane-fusion protein)